MYAIEMRTRVYPTEARCYCAKCAVFLDKGQEKNPNFKYLPKEEFNAITDHIVDDSVLNVFTVDQILAILLAIKNSDEPIDNAIHYFDDRKDKTEATVKFFGEFIPSGPCKGEIINNRIEVVKNRFILPANPTIQITETLHRCNNPSCKFEMMLRQDYPFVDQVVGRTIRNPDELQHPDDVAKAVMKKHVGSTIVKDIQVENHDEKNTGKDPSGEEK